MGKINMKFLLLFFVVSLVASLTAAQTVQDETTSSEELVKPTTEEQITTSKSSMKPEIGDDRTIPLVQSVEFSARNMGRASVRVDDDDDKPPPVTSSTTEPPTTTLNSTLAEIPTIAGTNLNFVLRNKETKVPCILANMKAEIVTDQFAPDGTQVILSLPQNNVTVNGKCNETEYSLKLWWRRHAEDFDFNGLILYFLKEKDKFSVDRVRVEIYSKGWNITGNDTKEETDNNLNLFPTPLGKTMYQCPEEQTVNIGEKIKVTFSEVSLIAYNEEILKPEEFSVDNCVKEESGGVNILVIVLSVAGVCLLAVIGVLVFMRTKRRWSSELP